MGISLIAFFRGIAASASGNDIFQRYVLCFVTNFKTDTRQCRNLLDLPSMTPKRHFRSQIFIYLNTSASNITQISETKKIIQKKEYSVNVRQHWSTHLKHLRCPLPLHHVLGKCKPSSDKRVALR